MIILQILAFLLALYGLAGFVMTFVKIKKDEYGNRLKEPKTFLLPFWKPALPVGMVLFVIISMIVKIEAQEVGVLVTPSGVKPNCLNTGWHVIAPWNDVFRMDKTVWVYTFSNKKSEGNTPDEDAIWAPTSEGIKMGFDMSVSWKIDQDFAAWIYQNVSDADGGNNGRYKWIENNIIRAKTKSVFALTVSKFSPIECYSTGRIKIQAEVEKVLRADLKKLHLTLDQVDIREVFYDPGYEKELNNKKIEEQKALTLKEVTKQMAEKELQAIKQKNITITDAEAEAQSLRIKGSSIASNPKIIELEWIQKWDGALPTYMMGAGQNVMLDLRK